MSSRREARLWAVQLLFQQDFNPTPLDELLPLFWAEHRASPALREFAESLARGVKANQDRIDGLLQRCAKNWTVPRMAAVDRNIMRVAVYEMLAVADIPAAVSINEAVELTKQLGDEKSPRFVNGILDRVRKELQRPAHDAGGGDKAAP